MDNSAPKHRIVILGGGFGAVATAHHLEGLLRRRPDVEVVLVSRDNFLLMTPLLFEVFSGALDLRDCSFPIRAFLRSTRFVEATVQRIDLDRRVVHLTAGGRHAELVYDQLVLGLGSKTNREMIPGSQHAFTFKTLADALLLRNHVIERFERADVENDPQSKSKLLTFAIIGGGLVGVELFGELITLVDGILPLYEHVHGNEIRFLLVQGADRIMPEVDPALAEYAARELGRRGGVDLRTSTRVHAIEPGQIHLANETIAADTIVLAAGNISDPVIASMPVEKNKLGRIVVDPTMRCPSRPEVWALGDCAAIPGPDGKPYPALAQHALRAGRVLAKNVVCAMNGQAPRPFVFHALGMMGSLGQGKGFGQFLKIRLHGFPAWFIRRTYYLLQVPGWFRRLRIVINWTFALLLRPDVVKVGLDTETALVLCELAAADAIA